MILTKTLKIKWNGSQKKHYESKGYIFTKFGDEFECRFEDIPHSSDRYIKKQCDYCGKVFEMQVKKHYRGNKSVNKDACKECKNKKSMEARIEKYGTLSPNVHEQLSEKNKKRYQKLKLNALNKMISTFKENDLIMLPSIYVNNETKMPYLCKKHIDKGIQWIDWVHLQDKRGCWYCGKESMVDKQKYSIEEVKQIIESNGRNKLLSTEYTGYNDYNLSISCDQCSQPYTTSLGWFRRGKKTTCNDCNASIGEKNIIEYLKSRNIDYEREKDIYINDREYPLRFDFYFKDSMFAIEFDGEQHFMPIDFKGEGMDVAEANFEYQKIKDIEKNNYCMQHNIILMRIPYWERDCINEVLDNYFINRSQEYIINNTDMDNYIKMLPKSKYL